MKSIPPQDHLKQYTTLYETTITTQLYHSILMCTYFAEIRE